MSRLYLRRSPRRKLRGLVQTNKSLTPLDSTGSMKYLKTYRCAGPILIWTALVLPCGCEDRCFRAAQDYCVLRYPIRPECKEVSSGQGDDKSKLVRRLVEKYGDKSCQEASRGLEVCVTRKKFECAKSGQ